MQSKTAFGIDICANAVSFVQLEKIDRQVKFLRASTIPLPEGIISDDIIQNPAALAAMLEKFNISGLLRNINVAMTICTEPVLLQILNLPESSPSEVKKIIQDEVRQYAILPLKNIEMDYCSLKSTDTNSKRVLVGATQTEHLNATVNAIEKRHINIKSIEPPITAFLRACFNKVIRPAGEKNIMFLLIRNETLTLCIFKRQKLEFLRTKKFDAGIVSSAQQSTWLSKEIESVIQFYELEDDSNTQPWKIIVAACPDAKCDLEIADQIKKEVSRQNVEVLAFDNSMMDIQIDSLPKTPICPVVVGAAMKLLGENFSGISLNLLPKEIVSIRKARNEMLVIANIAACLLILFFGYITFLSKKSISIGREVYAQKHKQAGTGIQQMVGLRKNLNDEFNNIQNGILVMNKLTEEKGYHNWAGLLAGLVRVIPPTVLIENLEGKGDNAMEIDGVAVNYDAINSFVNLLTQEGLVRAASLKDSKQNAKYGNGMINYKIVCYLKQ